MPPSFKNALRVRLPHYAAVIFVVWPLASLLMAAAEFRQIPYYQVPWGAALLGATAGVVLLAADFLIIGVLTGGLAIFLFSLMGCRGLLRSPERWSWEPIVLFSSTIVATSMFFPGIMGQQALSLFSAMPFWLSTGLLGMAVLAGCCLLSSRVGRPIVILAVFSCGFLVPLPLVTKAGLPSSGLALGNSVVLLGLDSIAQMDDVSLLRNWSAQRNGAWYSKPVTPGLLTNSVWTSLMVQSPIKDHGVFHIFQSVPKPHRTENLIAAAKSKGYWTVSAFSDQLTCFVGSELNFDENRSGPVGWRQLALSMASNGSLLLPILRPVLPPLSLSGAPPNHAGTFTYSLDRDLDEIFLARHGGKSVFVAAHTTYLHSPIYPSTRELTWDEIENILTAPVGQLRDRSLDWQAIDLPGDPIPLSRWKLRRLQKALIDAAERTRFLDRGGKLVLFSDHGERDGLTVDNFAQEKYHRVLLVTFGLASRSVDNPISLIDIGSLLGFSEARRFEPMVEFTLAPPSQWHVLAETARLRWDGRIELDEIVLQSLLRNLKGVLPWQ